MCTISEGFADKELTFGGNFDEFSVFLPHTSRGNGCGHAEWWVEESQSGWYIQRVGDLEA